MENKILTRVLQMAIHTGNERMDIDMNKSIVKSLILNGYSALHVAVLCENHIFTKTLLNFGSKTSLQDAEGLSSIHHGLKIKNAKVNKILFSAFMHQYDPADYRGISPLHLACTVTLGSVSMVKRYLQNFSDVNRQIIYENSDLHGYTPLHLAVTEGFAPLVQVLLNYGADLSIMNAKKMSPLHLAVSLGKYKIVDLLLTAHIGNLNNPVDYRGVSHFHIACYRGNIAVAEMFLLNGVALDDQVFTTSPEWPLYSALHFAALSSCTPIIKHLLSKGANPNCQDYKGLTPLNLACFEGLEKSAEMLLEYKVDLNIKSKSDSSPLQSAIIGGHYEIVKKLVEAGVDINSKDNKNETPPLITAAYYKEFPIMHYLLDNGADAAAKQGDGKTALHILALLENFQRSREHFFYQEKLSRFRTIGYASFDNECYQPDDTGTEEDYFFDCVVENLIMKGCDINARDNSQCTPLHLACQYRCIALVIALLRHGADIDAVDNRNCRALQYVINSYEPISIIFNNHINKLKYIGYPVSSWSKKYHKDNRNRKFFLRKVPSSMQFLYNRELNEMRNKIIDNYSSLYDFLIKDPDDLLAYTNNKALMEYVFHHDFKNVMYPEFGTLVQTNFRTAEKRARLFMSAKKSIQLFTKVPLPDHCLLKIFKYLNEEDVKQLMLVL